MCFSVTMNEILYKVPEMVTVTDEFGYFSVTITRVNYAESKEQCRDKE